MKTNVIKISNKDTPSHSQRSVLVKYIKSLTKRVYRPIKPVINPLLKKIKIGYFLVPFLLVGLVGNYQYWQEKKIYQQELKQKTQVLQEISFWEKELEKKPEYRDGLLNLTLLNFQIKEIEKAKDYWNKANYLDPNNESVQRVEKIIFFQP